MADSVDITMPQLGETVTEGTITRWTKAVGDPVAEDEVLYEVSTDKVDSEVPSPSSGHVSEILVPEGETVAVGTVLARISSAAPGGNGVPPAPEPKDAAESADAPVAAEKDTPAADAQATAATVPAEGAPAQDDHGSDDNGDDGDDGDAPSAPSKGSGGALLSPVVRRLIAEHDLDPGQIPGTGVGGRITRSDVLKLVGGRPSAPAPAAVAEAAPERASTPRPTSSPPSRAGERDEVIPFTRIRRATAEHMVRSKATSAHTLVAVEVDYLGVEKVRSAKKEAFKAEEGVGLTYLPFVARAVIDAIADYPHVNSSVGDDELVVHRYVDLGIAVDLGFEGLLVPVIRDAHEKRLRPIGREVGDLAAKARTKRLSPDDLVGGTFTITNAGPFGTFLTIPVISQPQTAILSTDGVKKKPVAVTLPDGSDGIAVHPVGILALSFDHRAFDGAYAAAFIARIKEILETRDWSTEI